MHAQNIDSRWKSLTIDCAQCCGLCCVALYFSKSEGFPAVKPAGTPCQNLLPDFRCRAHERLCRRGLKGCVAYDCMGAGQRVTQQIYAGKNWCTTPEIAEEMFSVFLTVHQLHQMLWYLNQADCLEAAYPLREKLQALILENERMLTQPPAALNALDLEPYRSRVNEVLRQAAQLGMEAAGGGGRPGRTGPFIGKNLKHLKLTGADFSMALLIAANLEGCNLRGACFLGADLRDTNLKNADLRGPCSSLRAK